MEVFFEIIGGIILAFLMAVIAVMAEPISPEDEYELYKRL